MGFLGALAVPCIICFLAAVILYAIEMFMPGFGIAGILGSCCFVAVIVMQFVGNTLTAALWVTGVLLVLLTAALILVVRSFQRGKLSRSRIVLHDNIEANSSPVTDDERSTLVGKTAVSVTPLRPSGLVELDGKRLNVETYGNFIPAGTSVTIVSAEGLNIYVK